MKSILMCLLVALMAGCNTDGQTPSELTRGKKPLTLIAVSDQGVVISDAEGRIYSYDENYYFAQTIMGSELKAGDKLGN